MIKKILSGFVSGKDSTSNYSSGKDTNVTGTVYKSSGSSTVEIGDRCLIEGTLTTYTPKASIYIGNNVFIGKGTLVGSAENIRIEDNVLISFDCIIQDNDTHSMNSDERKNDLQSWIAGKKDWSLIKAKQVHIGANAWIGAKSIILKGVTIGKNAIVGAGSVVTRDVEPNTVVAGNPAKFIKRTS